MSSSVESNQPKSTVQFPEKTILEKYWSTSAMICSISTGKSDSNWLDRLRSNKGFPVGDDLELDHFLENKDSKPKSKSNSSESTQNRKAATEEICGDNEIGDDKGEWFGIMNNVLSDLFIMGESNDSQGCKFSRKKISRKQTNPKFCLVSRMTSSNIEEEQSSGGCVRKDENAQVENELKEVVEGEEIVNNVAEMEDGEREELLGYSRNEVTVIDTSCTEWKFEKLVYRKRNVWKLREKKGKSRMIGLGRKKRKANGSDANVDAKKKFKFKCQEDCIFSSKHSPQAEEGQEVREETFEYPNQVPKKRLLLSTSPKKGKKGGKSASLRKGISTSKKSIAECSKSPFPNCGIEKSQVPCNKSIIWEKIS